MALVVKKLPANAGEMRVQPLGREDTSEDGMATHSSVLARRISIDRGAWLATIHGVSKSWTELRD